MVGVLKDGMYSEKRMLSFLWGMLWVELCVPKKILQVLTLSTCDCDLTWE